MDFEFLDAATEDISELGDSKLGSFQNPVFTEMMEHDLTPKIRFTTDKAEAEEAKMADHSNPLDLPDTVFYVEPTGEGAEEEEPGISRDGAFQNARFGIEVDAGTHDAAGGSASGDYVGPSPDAINLQMESDVRDLTFAQEQLAEAIARGTGVMQAMRNVESAQAVLDARMKLYNEAIVFRAPDPPLSQGVDVGETEPAKEAADQEPKLGSVSHAQWELEQAYKNDNKIAIENAKRQLAYEQAKEDAKK